MSSEDTLVERVSSFISENKRGIVIGVAAAAVAVGGVAYYVASSRRDGGARDEESLWSGKKRDKKKKRPSKTVKDHDGPILEERKAKGPEAEDDGCVYIFFASVSRSLVLWRTRQTSDRRADQGAL
jgi:import receptor subunit TOM70